jgi:hypothetical protein
MRCIFGRHIRRGCRYRSKPEHCRQHGKPGAFPLSYAPATGSSICGHWNEADLQRLKD